MITLISFLLVLIGCINWLCIGILQYDFVAGLLGSQANVFSRIVYAIIGIASLVLVYAAIKTKGCIKCNGKKSSDQELKLIKKKDKNKDVDKNNQQNDNNAQQYQQQMQYNQNNTPQPSGQYLSQNNEYMSPQMNSHGNNSFTEQQHSGQQNIQNYNNQQPNNLHQGTENHQNNTLQNNVNYQDNNQQNRQ